MTALGERVVPVLGYTLSKSAGSLPRPPIANVPIVAHCPACAATFRTTISC